MDRPGAGKGTQAALSRSRAGVAHIATGDLFRENIRNETELGKQAKAFVDRGELVPDELTVRMLLDRLDRPGLRRRACLLDGFPRTVDQAQALDEALKQRGQAVDKVLYINVGEEEVVAPPGRPLDLPPVRRRLPPGVQPAQGSRAAATSAAASSTSGTTTSRRRCETASAVFNQQTAPLIDYYRGQGKLVEVNGEQDSRLRSAKTCSRRRALACDRPEGASRLSRAECPSS